MMKQSPSRRASIWSLSASVVALAVAVLILLSIRPAKAGSFPGVNGKIYYRTDFNKIASIEADGSGYSVVNTAPAYWQAEPSVSAAGTKIAFTRFTGIFSQVHTMNSDGSNVVNVSNISAPEGAPSFSPDGTKIAFDSNRLESSDRDIYVMNADGTSVTRLTGTSGPPDDRDDQDLTPAWSPDGTKIAYASTFGDGPDGEVEDGFDIWIMDAANGANKTRLTTGGDDTNPVWSPDGTKIAFSRLEAGTESDIHFVTVATQVVSADLTGTFNGYADFPSWSPDGTQIVFSGKTCDSCDWELYTMSAADGSGRVQRTANTIDDLDPDWAPRPTGIVIEKQTVPDGSLQSFTFDPSWSPTNFDLSDGQRFTAVPLPPGVYSVTETIPGGWTLTTAVCSGDDDGNNPSSINLENGELVTCVFTNTEDAPTTGTITVIKNVAGLEPGLPWAFDFSGDLGAFQLNSDDPQETFTNVTAGEVTITEEAISGFEVAVECDSGETGVESVTVDLAVGEEVTCTFTNGYQPTLSVTKTITGTAPDAPFEWAFSGTGDIGAFTLPAAGGTLTFTLSAATTYTVTEQDIPGWVPSASCDNGTTGANSVSVSMTPGEEVQCTFGNTQCLPGFYDDGSQCKAADPGFYVPTAGAFEQTPCPPGFTSNAAAIECDIPVITTRVFVAAAAGTANNDTEPDVAYQTGDVLGWDGTLWTKYFDGTDNGLPAAADIIALDVDDADDGSMWVTWRQEITNVPGIGRARPWEVQYFNGSAFSRFFDGRDVGLTLAGERINGLEVLDASESPIGTGCVAYLLISTMAGGSVTNTPGPAISFTGEDVLGFCMTQAGATTTGLWHLVLDGQPYGVPRNATLGLAASDDAGTLWFTTKGTFPAGKNKILPFEPPVGPLNTTPVFDATAAGLTKLVDSIDYEE